VPTYQYACTGCDHQLEAVQSFSDDALTECPVCQGRLRKLYSAVGIVFKGSGFYRNDSRAGASGSDKPAAAATAGSSETSTTSATSSGEGSSGSSTTSSDTPSTKGGSSSTPAAATAPKAATAA
jgi:putative FmdB family regulatory protein